MGQHLSIATVIEKNSIASNTPFLVALDINVTDPATGASVEILRVVRNTEPIPFMGNSYEPANFDIETKQESGTQPTVTLTIRDYTKAIQGRMQAYGGGVGFKVTVMVLNAGALDLPPEVVEYFDVVGASAANYACSFTLGAENALMRVFPRRRQIRDFCSFQYKDPDTCGYAGSLSTCDLTLRGANGCNAHGNQARFGGFPGINSRDVRFG